MLLANYLHCSPARMDEVWALRSGRTGIGEFDAAELWISATNACGTIVPQLTFQPVSGPELPACSDFLPTIQSRSRIWGLVSFWWWHWPSRFELRRPASPCTRPLG